MNGNRQATRLIFTDLDGTLLDDTYDLATAAKMLDRWARAGYLVVATSSKTLPELFALNAHRELPGPLIYENGIGWAWPATDGNAGNSDGYDIHQPSASYATLCELLIAMQRKHGWNCQGFHQMTASEVSDYTGLAPDDAELAKRRGGSEPVLWRDSNQALAEFETAAAAHQLQAVIGGRFVHLMPRTSKGQALTGLIDSAIRSNRFSDTGLKSTTDVMSIACGDSANDLSMLLAADACVTFPDRQRRYLTVLQKPLVRAAGAGPNHWHNALCTLTGNQPQ